MLKLQSAAAVRASSTHSFVLFQGDCRQLLADLPDASVSLIVSSPPYFMGKEYDRSARAEDFEKEHTELAPKLTRVLRPGGSLCWQTGTHSTNGAIVPLDYLAYAAFSKDPSLVLRNRIIWHFEHGMHARKRFSGRHETVLWFTKGDDYTFDLDAVRVPQKYPGKKHYKGPQKGEISGHPSGKNPGDMWAVPNVKAKHREKTAHPCQFPIAIPQRLIRALTKPGDLVLDPFAGVASSGIAAALEGRKFIGCEIEPKYAEIGLQRYRDFVAGDLAVRGWDRPVEVPNLRQAVAQAPAHFRRQLDGETTALSKWEEEREVRAR
ncbi:MAG: site-specific DNA-methyltransferase [Bradyrhizobium sp.]|nr:site-specific DNA-methyltransferase [Bradyrhizobium sp.]